MENKPGVTRKEIAKACGFTLAYLLRFEDEEVINDSMLISGGSRTKRYDPCLAFGAIVQYYRNAANSRKSKDNAPVELRKNEADADLKRAKADMAELQLKELRGEMHRSEDVEAAFEDFGMSVRSILLSLPGRLAVNCANAANAAEVSDIIKKEVNDSLNELKEYKYDPTFYAKRVREREGWVEEDAQARDS